MISQIKKIFRKHIWLMLGTPPEKRNHHLRGIDTLQPRYEMLDYAITIVNHNTRVSRLQNKVGQKGSLLGDYLEFGCFDGTSFKHAFKRAAALMPWMRFWAFDSFQGLPKLTGPDVGGEFWKGQFSCTEEVFLDNLLKEGVDLERVICVPGWYKDTLTTELKRERKLYVAALIYIDCDLYNSAVPVLNFITDLIETGSVIMFDDWFCFKADPNKGVQRACREWLQSNPCIHLKEWHAFGAYGKSFIVVNSAM